MTKFSDFFKDVPEGAQLELWHEPETVEPDPKWAEAQKNMFSGAFSCQTCNEASTSAEYLPNDRLLQWVCASGHTSKIKYNL